MSSKGKNGGPRRSGRLQQAGSASCGQQQQQQQKRVTFTSPARQMHHHQHQQQQHNKQQQDSRGNSSSSIRTLPHRRRSTNNLSDDNTDSPAVRRSGLRSGGVLVRKRSYSFSEGAGAAAASSASSSSAASAKRWKTPHHKYHGKGKAATNKKNNVLPSKFLLGGNIRDPLNLNSLADDKVAKVLNAITPESSPLPTPKHRKPEYKIEVLIPPNISDPLNLNSGVDENEYESKLISPGIIINKGEHPEGKKRKYRFRKRSRSASARNRDAFRDDDDLDLDKVSEELKKKQKKYEAAAKASVAAKTAASAAPAKDEAQKQAVFKEPAVPLDVPSGQPSESAGGESGGNGGSAEVAAAVMPSPAAVLSPSKEEQAGQAPKKKHKGYIKKGKGKMQAKAQKFQYGNYRRYYGYRCGHTTTTTSGSSLSSEDSRFRYFKPEWFHGKDVLDVGCNNGHVSIALARGHATKSIVGIDIDTTLVDMARKNLRHVASLGAGDTQYPVSLPLIFGPLNPTAGAGPKDHEDEDNSSSSNSNNQGFPHNVRFVCGNYVLDSDDLLEAVQPEFDVIICLSTTKWMHLNFGDDGVKRAFKRMYAQLRPGGILILEAQNFQSYCKKKKLSPRIYENFLNIKLRPEQFSDYLIHEVGFMTGHVIGIPHHSAKGFHRPIQIFVKRNQLSSRSVSSRQTTPYNGPSPMPFPSRSYAPTLTPLYGGQSPYPSGSKTPRMMTPQPGPSSSFFPGYSPIYAPMYSPGDTPTYSGHTPGHSGITPGYSGPSPDDYHMQRATPAHPGHSPVYTGPPPGLMSQASTPGHPDDFLEPRYTPSYQVNYTPSNPGTPSYNPGTPPAYSPHREFSPGNATPKDGGSTPGTSSNSPVPGPSGLGAGGGLAGGGGSGAGRAGNAATSTGHSPQIQQPEVSGNTTPHPGAVNSPGDSGGGGSNPRYLWYGYSSSGGNTPQSSHDTASMSPRVYPTHYPDIPPPPPGSEPTDSNPATPATPSSPATPATPSSPGQLSNANSPREQ